jgi:hypothetical protein
MQYKIKIENRRLERIFKGKGRGREEFRNGNSDLDISGESSNDFELDEKVGRTNSTAGPVPPGSEVLVCLPPRSGRVYTPDNIQKRADENLKVPKMLQTKYKKAKHKQNRKCSHAKKKETQSST